MKNFRIIPRLEIKDRNLIKGIRLEGLRKIGDPKKFALKYQKDLADEIFFDNIVSTLYREKLDFDYFNMLTNTLSIPVCISGGINSIKDSLFLFKVGASKISINSHAVKSPKFLSSLINKIGSQSISVLIQTKKFKNNWEVMTESGRNRSNIELFSWISKIQEIGIGEIFILFIDDDGKKNTELDCEIVNKISINSKVPVLVGGGIDNYCKIKKLYKLGIDGCVISRSLHFNEINIKDIKSNLIKSKFKLRF
jgi:imidazole glycerol-phosphate synthase subunit HisF